MCGITGIFGEQNPALIKSMNCRLAHRGPDEEGVYVGPAATLGSRRLAIIDLATGRQPIANEERNAWIVFNGEIYNHQQLRKELEARNHRFTTHTDTEVILHLFEEKGTETPRFLRGDFAFAVWNERDQRGFLARDHLGVKPLYYAPLGEKVIFSSELKALVLDQRLSLELDPQALDLYLAFLYIPAPRTIYKNVFKLPPGCYLEYAGGKYRVERYWQPPTDQTFMQDEEELEGRTYERLKEAVALRLMSDVPLGVFLSGGIDSSAIVALASYVSSKRVKTFSVGFENNHAGFNELEFSRLVSRHFGTEHREFIINPNIQHTIFEVVHSLDEPLGDSSTIPTFLVSQETSREVKVALSGIGGDELFGGYPRYLGALWQTPYETLPLPFRRLLAQVASWVPEQESSRNIGGWIRDFLSHPADLPLDRYRKWMSFNSAAERRALYAAPFHAQVPDPPADRAYFQQLVNGVRDWRPADQVFYLDLVSYLVNDLLHLADQMSMAHSLEVRVPFCDHMMVESLIRVPWRQKIGPFTLKKLLKRILREHLPIEILNRRKQGFMIPIGSWMKTELRPLFQHYLAPERVRRQGIFEPQQIEGIFRKHLSGKERKTDQLWSLFVFQLWYEQHLQ